MPLTLDQDWNEVEKILQKPQVLSISDSGDIMMTLTWEDWEQETLPIQEYLDLTDFEKREFSVLKSLGYTLIWERRINSEYPEYFKDFHDKNSELFLWWKEIYVKRDQFKPDTSDVIFSDREKRELIFVKLNLPKVVAPQIQEEITNLKGLIKRILGGI